MRDVYERAIANVPPAPDKRLWRRYIYLWLRYAVFEELVADSPANARAVLANCRRIVAGIRSLWRTISWIHPVR